MFVTESKELFGEILPLNTTYKEIEWISDDPNIITINSNGKIEAKSVGKAIITAKHKDAEIQPESAKYQEIKWSVDNNEIATIINGRLKILSTGIFTLTAEAADGTKEIIDIKVNGDIPIGLVIVFLLILVMTLITYFIVRKNKHSS